MKSWKPVVQTDGTGKWYDNALRFATKEEAMASAQDLSWRWMLVRDFSAHESEDPVNFRLTRVEEDGKFVGWSLAPAEVTA